MEKVEHKSYPVITSKISRYVMISRENISRREQILYTLTTMLETCPGERITTARLAAEVGVSEAALYRHFPSKAKIFEGLIESIEETLFAGIADIVSAQPSARVACEDILSLLILFCEHNPGLSRILTGDVLNGETERLRLRVVRLFDQLEQELLQNLGAAERQGELCISLPTSVTANMLLAMVEGAHQPVCTQSVSQ